MEGGWAYGNGDLQNPDTGNTSALKALSEFHSPLITLYNCSEAVLAPQKMAPAPLDVQAPTNFEFSSVRISNREVGSDFFSRSVQFLLCQSEVIVSIPILVKGNWGNIGRSVGLVPIFIERNWSKFRFWFLISSAPNSRVLSTLRMLALAVKPEMS